MALDAHLARHYWHLIAHRGELAEDRDYLRFPWLLGDLVVYNDKGNIIAFDNLCPHRGARFFQEVSGHAPALCRYHGWSYRGGQLRIPKPDTYRPCDIAGAKLNQFATAWCGDFLFVAVAPQSDLATQLAGAWPLLVGISADIDRRRDFNHYTFECPWRVAVENVLDADHVHGVHAKTLGLLDLSAGENRYFGYNSLFQAELGNPRMAQMLRAMRRFFDLRHQHEGYSALFLFPFSFLTSTFGYAYALQSFLPSRTQHETHFSSRLLAARPANAAAVRITDGFFTSVAEMNRKVFAEDHDVCRSVDPNFPLDGPLSTAEEKISRFRADVAAVGAVMASACTGAHHHPPDRP